MSEFAVIGVGRFGRAVARGLTREGQSVLAVDLDPERLELLADEVDATARADTTDERTMSGLGLERMAAVVVTIGSRAREASILTVAILRGLNVARIVARAFDDRHARLLLSIGADEVLVPEDEIGQRLAWRLASPALVERLRLGEGVVAEVEAPVSFVGRTVRELEEESGDISVLAVRGRAGPVPHPAPEQTLEAGDLLLVLGPASTVERFTARM